MRDTNTEPKDFIVKLKYKVGSEYHYTTLEKFDFDTIRDSNMYDREKQIVKEDMQKNGETWTNNMSDFLTLKEHLKKKDKLNYQFKIPLSTYYFTFDNLQGFLNQKQSISPSQRKFSTNVDDNREKMVRINELLSKDQLRSKINNYIEVQTNTNNTNYVYSLQKSKDNLVGLFNLENLKNTGYLNDPTNKSIGQGVDFIYRFLYFIFYKDLQDYFQSQANSELDIVSNDDLLTPSAKEFLKNCANDKIVIVKNLENLQIIVKNMSYLNDIFKNTKSTTLIPKIKALKKFDESAINKVIKGYTHYNKYKNSSDDSYKIYDLLKNSNQGVFINEFINDKVSKVLADIQTKFNDEILSQGKIYEKFEKNMKKFFITPKVSEALYVTEYFKFLEENFKDNEKYKDLRGVRIDRPIPYNTDDGRKKIVKDYGKYILGDEYYENSDIDKLYSSLKADQRRLSYIITYYNIFKILETFYLPNGCILHNKFFRQEIKQQDGAPQIKKSKDKIYVKVKSIKCIKYNEEMLRDSFEQDVILKPYYEIEFEEIPTYSNIIFYINLIDRLNPKTQLEDALENYSQEFSEPHQKKTIREINSETLIYRRHTNDMFSKNKYIDKSNNKIFIQKNLDIKKTVNRFDIIKSNNKIFKSLQVETIEDALMISDTFTAIKEEKELINETNSNDDVASFIFKYYIERFYFEIDKHLFVDGKYAQIKKVTLRVLNSMSFKDLQKNKLSSTTETEQFLQVSPSKTTRLAVNGVDSSYYVYLDVEVVFKNSPTDRIPIKDQINYGNDCIGKATVLDRLLWGVLGIDYPRRYLENKLRKKNSSFDTTRKQSVLKSIPSAAKTNKEPLSEKSQTGGTNKNLTRKIISKQKNKTMKNLVHYYTI
jgi:hypothetical protein